MTAALWPSAEQLLLLRAALWDGDRALAAFEEWRTRQDYEQVLDGGSFRILPLLHANMRRLGCGDPAIQRLAGVYRHSWCTVQTRLRRASDVIASLQAQGIKVLTAKGAAMALAYYDSPGLRPMSDVDLVVRREQLQPAMALLRERGWRIGDAASAARFAQRARDVLAMTWALSLKDPEGIEIDLHWRMIGECAHTEAEERFWACARPLVVNGVDTLRPSPTHLLFHVIVHALKPDPFPAIRWIADAAMILRRDAPKIDWQEMAWLAEVARVRQRLGSGIAYLRDAMQFDLPEAALALAPARPCWVERIEQRAFRADLTHRPTTPLWIQKASVAARMSVGSARGQIPGLTARWAGRRMLRLVRPA